MCFTISTFLSLVLFPTHAFRFYLLLAKKTSARMGLKEAKALSKHSLNDDVDDTFFIIFIILAAVSSTLSYMVL